MLSIRDVKVTFKDCVALDVKEEIKVNVGEKVGIIGSNGAGKTTLINAIIGRVPYSGTIENKLKYSEIAVHQQINGYNEFVSVKTIIEAVINDSIKNNQKINELIEFFDFRPCLNKRYKKLSGGEKQKLTILLVIMQDAPLTIYDEVTSGLDFETRINLMYKLNEIYQEKVITMLLVSHYYEELEHLVDKIILLDKGNVIVFGKVADLFRQYCGDHIIVAPENEVTLKLARDFKSLIAPKGKIALSCDGFADSEQIVALLNQEKQEYAVRYNDIEVMALNAKQHYYSRGGSNEQI